MEQVSNFILNPVTKGVFDTYSTKQKKEYVKHLASISYKLKSHELKYLSDEDKKEYFEEKLKTATWLDDYEFFELPNSLKEKYIIRKKFLSDEEIGRLETSLQKFYIKNIISNGLSITDKSFLSLKTDSLRKLYASESLKNTNPINMRALHIKYLDEKGQKEYVNYFLKDSGSDIKPNVLKVLNKKVRDYYDKESKKELRKLVREQVKLIFDNFSYNILNEQDSGAFAASNTKVPFDLDLMKQAIKEGREVGILYKGDEEESSSGKHRLIYPVAIGISKSGNRVVRAVHNIGQSESVAKKKGVRSAEVKNVWRLFKTDNIKGMWMTGNFFNFIHNSYNPNDKSMTSVELSADLSKIKKFQLNLLQKQKENDERKSKIIRFKEKNERPLEQPIKDPETKTGSELESSEQQD